MIHTVVQLTLWLGFFATWVGFACLFVAILRPNFSMRRVIENQSLPYGEGMKRMNEDFLSGVNYRLGRFGQLLLAIGLFSLAMGGLNWVAIQIVGSQAAPS